MAAGFGFSVGDIVAGLKLIKQSIEAVQDTKGSATDYQALSHEIDSLKDGLEAIEDLRLHQRFGPKSKQGFAVQEAISRCWHCIDTFLSTTAKYQPWLQSDAPQSFSWRANLKKIQWALCKKDDVNRFRAQLERHCSSISMLLVTLQVSQSFSQSAKYQDQCQVMLDSHNQALDLQKNYHQTTALLAGLSLEQRQLFQLLIESNRQLVSSNERMSYELRQMRGAVQLQLELPPQVVLQKPVTLLDACGQVSAFHLDFINSPEAFLAVLKIRFAQLGVEQRGLQMLDDSQFVLEDRKGRLDLAKPWSQILKPSQKVEMSMVFHREIHPSICPVCRGLNENDFGSAIECQSCGLYYQRVQELVVGPAKSPDVTHATSFNHGDSGYNDGHDQMSVPEHSDPIDQFRRVQLVSIEFQAEDGSEAEASSEVADGQFNQKGTLHTDSMPQERNPYTGPLSKGPPFSLDGEGTRTDEGATRPQLSYFDLIHEALSSSKHHQLPLRQIYHAIEQRHPYYKSAGAEFGWQSSVRRNLKRDPAFREIKQFGASSVWELVPNVSTEKGKQKRRIQSSASIASPLHLFGMSAALLDRVEQHHND
ncbi:MAG: hypothetical protein Q9172_000733 [Xanthocarpia lactea]